MEAATELRTAHGLLALQRLPRVGPTTALRAALRAQAPTVALKQGDLLGSAFEWAEQVVRQHQAAGVHVITFFDKSYPPRLTQLADPPPILYVHGNVDLIHRERLVAVVGTREPSRFGVTAATEIVECVGRAGWGIVSGLARGIDTIAHRAALETGAPTIAILGNGLDRTYPKANTELAEAIVASGGAIASELPFGAPPSPRNLIARDRLQSGMSVALVVAQSGIRGGAMHTARFAVEQGRPLFCPLPHDENGKSEGLRVLLDRPGRELPALVPAWRAARTLSMGLGDRPVARPIERGTLDVFLEDLERLLAEPAGDDQQALVVPDLYG